MAASATAAFIAENAATLGIVAAIAVLVAASSGWAPHWQEVWGAIKTVALDVWHNVLDPMWQDIKTGAEWLYNVGIKPVLRPIKAADPAARKLCPVAVAQRLRPRVAGHQDRRTRVRCPTLGRSGHHRVDLKNPVNFLIGTVYDNGIRRFWNDIVTHIGLASLELPEIAKLADGGVVPGTRPGNDNQLVAMRSPGEGVLVPEAVQAIGPGTVHALNKKYGGSDRAASPASPRQRHGPARRHHRGGRRHSMRLGEHAARFLRRRHLR